MNVESRMDEFSKVSHKQNLQDVSDRMEEFEPIEKVSKYSSKDKYGTLPYGIKPIKCCPECGEFMDIHEIKDNQAIYYCMGCSKTISIVTEK